LHKTEIYVSPLVVVLMVSPGLFATKSTANRIEGHNIHDILKQVADLLSTGEVEVRVAR